MNLQRFTMGVLAALLWAPTALAQQTEAPTDEGSVSTTAEAPLEPQTPVAPPPAPVVAQPENVVVENAEEEESIIGKVGVGYFTTSAPIGIRRWASESWGYDVGIGFGIDSEETLARPDTAWSANVEAGLLFALAHLENIIVFARGGMGLGLSDTGEINRDLDFNIVLDAMVGGEFFLTALGFPNLSFTGGVGVGLNIIKPDGGDTHVEFGTGARAVDIVSSVSGVLGFHIYF